MNITELSIRRPVTTIMLFVSMVAIGLIAAFRLPLEAEPEATIPFFFVSLPYPGSTPEEVERNLLRPVEEAIATMPGIKSMNARANAEGGQIQVEFSDWNRDIAMAASEARERIDAVRDQLPDDFRRYYVQRWSTSDREAMSLRLTSDEDLTARADLIERSIKQRLERLPGVARVEVEGVAKQEVLVALDKDRLSAHGVALNELVQKLQAANFSVSAGQITEAGRRLRVQPRGELLELQALRNLPVDKRGTRLSDIAEVSLQPQRMNYVRQMEGRPSVGVDVYKERSANLVDLSRAVRTEIERLQEDPAMRGVGIEVTDDQGQAVTSSLLALAEAGAIGLLLSVIVLYAFLRHWPSTLMVSLAIPICFIMTLGFMYFAGITMNIISMMGLLLAVGMLVDNAVVVVESIYQEREKYPDQPSLASIIGTRHVAIALSAGTLCHCVVFLPMMFGEKNIITIYLSQLAVTISVSLLASWLVAVSLIPMLSARMKTPPALKSPLINRMQERYARALRWTLQHRGWAVGGILAISLASVYPMTHTTGGGDDGDPSEINIFYQWRGAYSKEEMGREVARVEAFVNARRKEFHVERVFSRYSEQGWAQTRLFLDTEDPALSEKIKEEVRKGLPQSARAKIGIGWPGGMGSDGQGIRFSLVGDSTQTLKELAEDIVPILARDPKLRDVRVDTGDANTELAVRVDRERAAAYGFSAQQVAQFVGMALRGSSLRDFHRDDVEIPVNVRFAGSENYGIEDLSSFMVRTAGGKEVPLLAMVDVSVTPAASSIQRLNRQTMLRVEAGLAKDVPMDQARKAIETTLEGVQFPPGYGYTFAGAGFNINFDGMQQMVNSIFIALILMVVIMAAVFESLLFPAAIMSCVLFSIFGVYWLFWLTGTEMNIMAVIGILVLMGVVVNNGIVMIEHINNLRRRGMARTDALVEGSRERLRPIMMTMGTAILAMIPIALNTKTADGMPPYYPMARAIAGGLAFSTVVSLLFLPTIYAILDDLRTGTARLVRRARGLAPLPAAGAAPVRE
ncbi:MAG: acriflavin resistance protein [Lysobacteraceae bacterium SCN 69-123]|uniref:efflux RND transporter permease subunit n=1 Tax=Stenotrophomonas acidaminiphila TaxID=128780 RepID=UPI00086AC69D|nr:efflux RND transporter permease subunit [Stenotrophomonas acidaminiphila]MDF9440238.1 efflux RND transporter permease subunit [Stenotrophomonas acidaminiphila]ODU45975.1 MAG: acriflavin resistance protein [Xanthomonadaceae bacterium SCN 69-123]OJY76769.1 MAG: acriflavin resistance protein [Stenotrophomonas sp. 69-14]